jgi:hypothetical protein
MVLVFAQLSGADSLRGLAAAWGVGAHHHYHLGGGADGPLDPVGR